MFDIAPSEMLVVALVAIVFIGPKDLPRVMRMVGQWVGRGRSMARHFRSAVDEMIRESELAEMEQKWKAENERIMREHSDLIEGVASPVAPARPLDGLPPPAAAEAAHDAGGSVMLPTTAHPEPHAAPSPAAPDHRPEPAATAKPQA